jgi:hypothetical protein
MSHRKWYYISVKGLGLGRIYETLENILRATGPYVTITGNHINVWGQS